MGDLEGCAKRERRAVRYSPSLQWHRLDETCVAFTTASGMIPQVAFVEWILCDEGIRS